MRSDHCLGNGLFRARLITTEDTGGIELRFGNAEAMVALVEQIGKREDFGDLLAEGSARAAKTIGRGAEDLVVTVKKQELPAHMPQVKPSLGLIYAVNPFGADHQSSEHDGSYEYYPERMAMIGLTDPQPDNVMNEEKVRFALITEYIYSALDSYNLCQFVYGPSWHLYDPDQMVETIRAITGWDVDMDEVLTVGQRRLNLIRAFNAREGFGRDDDKLPKKLSKALVGGRSDGLFINGAELNTSRIGTTSRPVGISPPAYPDAKRWKLWDSAG